MRDVRTIILAAVSRRDLCYVSENEGFRFGGAHVLSGSDFLNAISYFLGPIWFSDPTFLFFWPGKSESEFLMTRISYTRTWVYAHGRTSRLDCSGCRELRQAAASQPRHLYGK